jgi:predicted porin
VTAFQGDVTWTPGQFEVYGHLGWMEDADTNGSLDGSFEDRWLYGSIEGAYHINERAHVAARYGIAMADALQGVQSDGKVHRIQVGGGYWLTKNVLVKGEYVYQWFNDFAAGNVVSGVDAEQDPSFHGFIFEVSFAL